MRSQLWSFYPFVPNRQTLHTSAAPCSTLEARWGFTTPFHSHSKCLKCFISLQEPQVWLPSPGPGALPGSGSELPLGCAATASTMWGGRRDSCVPSPNSIPLSSCRCAGQEGPAEPLWPKKSHQWKARRGTTIQLSCAMSSGHGVAGPSCGSNTCFQLHWPKRPCCSSNSGNQIGHLKLDGMSNTKKWTGWNFSIYCIKKLIYFTSQCLIKCNKKM